MKVSEPLKQAMEQAYLTDRWPWYLHGAAGTGKSCAAGCVCAGMNGWWINAQQFIPELVQLRMNGILEKVKTKLEGQNRGENFAPYPPEPLVVLDDVCSREMTGPQSDALLYLLNLRGKRPMIITGNLDPAKLATVMDDRIVSRICAGVIIEVEGDDRRLEQALILKA